MEDTAFTERYGPWALIAGGSEGIGASFARALASRGLNVALLARNAEPLEATAASLRATTAVEVRAAAIDLTSPTLVDDLAPLVDGVDVGLLVYNAGATHGARHLLDQPLEHALNLVALNCRGPLLLTHRFAPAMVGRGRGGIILMTSMSAACGSAYVAAYSATKAFDLVLAESLWIELGQSGVDVLAVVAGLTDTPAMRRSGLVMEGAGFVAMDPADVVDEALAALRGRGPMLVVGDQNREMARTFWPQDRGEIVELMTGGAAGLYELPALPRPTAG